MSATDSCSTCREENTGRAGITSVLNADSLASTLSVPMGGFFVCRRKQMRSKQSLESDSHVEGSVVWVTVSYRINFEIPLKKLELSNRLVLIELIGSEPDCVPDQRILSARSTLSG